MRRLLTVALLFLFWLNNSVAQSAQVKSLTLQEAIAIGKENNKMLRASGAKLDAASAKASEASAALLPSVRLQASYTRLSDVDPFQVKLPISPTPIVISPTVLNNYNLKLGIQQPLFAGFRLSSNAHAAEFLAQASEADTRNDQADLVLNITGAYWTVYQTEQTKLFVDENVTRLESYRTDTENLLKSGMATRNDKLRVEVQLANAKLQQIDAVNDVQVARMNMNNILGLPLDAPVKLASEPGLGFEEEGRPVQAGTTRSERPLLMRPDLQAMQSRIEASREYVTAAQGGWLPQVFATGNLYYARPNQRYLPTLDAFTSTWDLGVSLQWDVWNWLTPQYQTDHAKAQLRQNELVLEQLKDNAELEVTRTKLGVERARKKIEVAGTGVAQADENVRILKDKYRQGLATSTELLDADVAMLQAKTNLTGAQVELEVASAKLKKAVGEGN